VRPTHRVGGYLTLVTVGLTAALVAGRPEPAVLATPFALVLVAGLAMGRVPEVAVRLRLGHDRVLEGDEVAVVVTSSPGVELVPLLDPSLTVIRDEGEPGRRTLVLRPSCWGAFDVGRVAVRAHDPLRLRRVEGVVDAGRRLRVHPTSERLRRAVASHELQPFVGQHASRARGDGLHFADLRPYVHGDRQGAVNWRATARRGELWVNDRHPERTADVVVLLDTYGSAADERPRWLDLAVRSLVAVAEAYHRSHDRVGLLTFGGHLRWLRPASGRVQLLRLVDALLDSEVLLTQDWEGTLRIPAGALPPRSLLLAVSALDDDTSLLALLDLRARGFDVAVLAVPPGSASGDPLAVRLQALQRDARRLRLERLGIAVADASDGVGPAVEEVNRWRERVPTVRG
jgi:uncharacterized protein (DUF58 family)